MGYVLPWDLARYVNHSCDANVRDLGSVGGIAVRDIHVDDEINSEYSTILADPFECHCQSVQCRKIISSQDILDHWECWDGQIKNVLHLVREVPQPILHCIKNDEYHKAIIKTIFGDQTITLPSHKDFL